MDYAENFYRAVNQDWLREEEKDGVTSDFFSELEAKVATDLHSRLLDTLSKPLEGNDKVLAEFQIVYSQLLNISEREAKGLSDLSVLIRRCQELGSFEEYATNIFSLMLEGYPVDFPLTLTKLSIHTEGTLFYRLPDLLLPHLYYRLEDEKEQDILLEIWKETNHALLEECGLSSLESDQILESIILSDRTIAALHENEGEMEYLSLNDLVDGIPTFTFATVVKSLTGQNFSEVYCSNRSWREYSQVYYSEQNWLVLKSRLIYHLIMIYRYCLTLPISQLADEFVNKIQGIEGNTYRETAFEISRFMFSDAISYWYQLKTLSVELEASVMKLVEFIREAYMSKIQRLENFSLEARREAIQKIQNISIILGGGLEYFGVGDITEERSLVENVREYVKWNFMQEWSSNCSVSNKNSRITSYDVNAYYISSSNSVVLPVGLLKSLVSDGGNVLSEESLGKLGFLIAHEMAHALDMESIQYDSRNQKSIWWRESDKQLYQAINNQLSVDMDGDLTEIWADFLGFSCILYKAKLERMDLKRFFISYAELWKETIPYFHSKNQSHSRGEVRVNTILRNFSEFMECFHVRESDKMWKNLESRVKI